MSGLSHSSLWGLKAVQWRAAVPKSHKEKQWQWGQSTFGAYIWGYSSQYPQKTQKGLGVLHEDRSSNQRLRKLGPLEVVYKLQWRNLFGVFVPGGIWGFLAHCRVSRAAQSLGIRQATAGSCSMLSWNGNTRLGLCLCFPAGPKCCGQGGTQALLTWFICHARVSFLNFNDDKLLKFYTQNMHTFSRSLKRSTCLSRCL